MGAGVNGNAIYFQRQSTSISNDFRVLGRQQWSVFRSREAGCSIRQASIWFAQADLDTMTGWLQSQGFTVNAVATGRRSVEFSGTASQVEHAFHTEVHRYRASTAGWLGLVSDSGCWPAAS